MRHSVIVVMILFASTLMGQSVTVTNATVKVRPGDGPGPNTSAEIHAAQNEFEAFQVIITGPTTNVSATAPTLSGPGGATIPAGEVRLYREAYLNITTASDTEGSTGSWPDPLVPDVDEIANEKRNAFPFDVPAGENRVIWVDVHVPKGQTPGTYTGSLTITGSGLGTVAVPVTLLVWNFELPSTSSLASTFGMGWDDACVAHFGSYDGCGGDAGVERMHLLYARFMLDHRITQDVVYTGPGNCSGTSCDWSHFDSLYGPIFDGTDSSLRLQGAQQTTIQFIWSKTSDHYAAWAQHFRQKGWFDRTYDYTCDEPPGGCAWSDISTRAAVVHGADAQFRTLVTTMIDVANQNNATGSINILTPIVNYMDDKSGNSQYTGNQRPTYDPFLTSNSNNRLWWYQSCFSDGCNPNQQPKPAYFTGWPSFMVDVNAVQNRSQGMLSWLYKVSGVLYYETTLHLDNAWNSVYDFGGNGDGTLLYPGKPSIIGGATDIPVASIRLKMIREGFEDYEYMKLVSDLGDPTFAQNVGNALFPDIFASNQTPQALYNAREQLAQRILQLKGQTGPTVTMTAPTNGSSVSGVITLSATASDAQGVAGVTFLVDGTATGGEITTAPYNTSFNTATVPNGSHTFAARARNNANATTTSGAVTVSVNNSGSGTLTLVTGLALSPANPAVNQSTTASFTVKNTGTAAMTVQYFLVGARDPSNANVDFPATAPITLAPGQTYTYSASRAFATAGSYSAWPAWFDGANWNQLASPVNFTVATGSTGPLFFDDFNRTSGLGANWSVFTGGFTTDGSRAVSGTPSGGNWAKVVPSLGTNDYAVAADMTVPPGSLDSGIVARSHDPVNFDQTLYTAQIATDGHVNLYRRNDWNWTLLGSVATTITANTSYNVKLIVTGANPVHLEVWLNGAQTIVFNDSSTSQIATGVPGMQNYDPSVTYDNFTVTTGPLFFDGFDRTSGLGANWAVFTGGFTTDGSRAVSGTPAGGNWAKVVPSLGTNDYAVAADMTVPPGSLDSGIVARSHDPVNFDQTLYTAQIATDGHVNLYRRNDWNWTLLSSVATTITANTSYNVKLIVKGANPVHLEVWLNGAQTIVFNDSSTSQIATGVPGIQNYDPSVTYDNFTITQP